MIERIKRVRLRDIWKHEAKDFTVWLTENIDILKEATGLVLLNAEREQSTGNFSVDILAEDESGNTVIIENQLEKSNHDHLGKVITYLTSFDAKIAIWIVSEPREEHIKAISWLNESTDSDFYLLKVEGIQIGDSAPAPLLTKIVGASQEAKMLGAAKKNKSELHKIRYRFWSGLLEKAKGRIPVFNAISPTQYNWIGASAGLRGVNYTFWITKNAATLRLYIDRGKESDEENLIVFNKLVEKKVEIEKSFGNPLVWEELENYRSCVVLYELKDGGYNDESAWDTIQESAIEAMIKMVDTFKNHIKKIKL